MKGKSFSIAALSAFAQYYNYHLFGFLAINLGQYFSTSDESMLQLKNTYLFMALAMLGKPVGALALGRVGDIYGRSNVFGISMAGTSLASAFIAFTPDYRYVGIIATIIILLARTITCALVGSGSDGVRIYVYEHLGKDRQCFGVSLTNIFVQFGSFSASAATWFFTLDFLPKFAWRGAFLLGSIIGFVVVYLKYRWQIGDEIRTKENDRFREFEKLSSIGIIRKNFVLFISCLVITGCIGSTTQFFIIFFGTYNFGVLKNIDQSTMQFYTSVSLGIYMVFSLVSGWVCDRYGNFKIISIAVILLCLLSVGNLYVLSFGDINIPLYLLTICTLPLLTMPAALILKQSIPIVIRYRIFSLSHAMGSILISAPTAFVSTWLYYETNLGWLPMLYFIFTISLMFIFLNKAKNYIAQKA
ncbi:MAG: MFS transporter [Janthinobacterium lividum]